MARINGSVSQRSDSYSFYIDWSESKASNYIETNQTTVSATAYIYCSNHTAYASGLAQKLIIDGTEFTATKTVNLSSGVTVALVSGSKTITHNADGKKSITISANCDLPYGSGWGPNGGSASGIAELTSIPRQANISSAPNFNDEENPTITYSNPAGNAVDSLQACISLTGSEDDIVYRNISKTGSSYTFNLTTAERNVLRNATSGNSRKVKFFVRTGISGTTYYSSIERTLSIVNANPTFSNFTYKDVGSVSTQLTGNNQIVISNYNEIKITIPAGNKAVAKKGATMSKYRVVCGNKSAEASYSSSSDINLTLSYVTNRTFTVYAIDSRGNSTAVTKSVAEWRNYSDIAIKTGTAERTGGVGKETKLIFEGTFWKTEEQLDFGAVANEITLCQYRYKKSNESNYSEPVSITPIISNDKFSFSSIIKGDLDTEGFNISNSFNIEITVKDKIKTSVYNVLLGTGIPAIAIHKNGVAFGAPYNEDEGGLVQVGEKNILGQKVLWDDYLYMNASQTVNVPISQQTHGIMLMFCAYSDGQPHNWNWANFVILKKEAEILNGAGRTFPMGGSQGIDATKYIYIYPNKIEGNDANQQGNSKNYALRKIIGF